MKHTEMDLVQAGLDEHQLALLRQQHSHLRSEGRSAELGSLAVRSRFVNLADLEALEESSETESLGDSFTLQSILPLEYCKRFLCVPVELTKGTLRIKCAQPLNAVQKTRILQMLTTPVQRLRMVPSSRQEVFDALLRIEQSGSVGGLVASLRQEGLEAGRLRSLVYAVLKEALSLRASDIHLSRKSDPDAWIAYRVDSSIRQTHLLPELLMQSLVARIKIEAGMDASNSRTAQDGRIAVEHDGRVVDFRISTQPLVDGESVVLRAADGSVLTVNAVELKVSNFTAQKLRASSVYSQRLEAEMARIVELEVNNLRANSAVANTVQAEQVNTGSAQVYAGVGMPAVLFSAKSDGHYTVNTSALDGSYATATVIVNAGQAKVIGGQNEGIELYAEGNTIKALAAGKSIKASWIKTG